MRRVPALVALALSAPVFAQASPYYLVAGENGDLPGDGSPAILVVRNGVITATWPLAPGSAQYQYAIAVDQAVRTAGRDPAALGAEYDLAGVPTGPFYPHPPAVPQTFFDGTTDRAFNYALDIQGTVWRCDTDWSAPTVAFSTTTVDLGSIAYDRFTDTFWVAKWSSTLIEQYDPSGTLLSSFDAGHRRNVALAFDPLDATLWLHDRTAQGTLENWATDGTLIARVAIPGLDQYNAIGGEMRVSLCGADLNADTVLNLDDVAFFVTAFGANDPAADVNADGSWNLDDIDLFVGSFLAGCE